MEGEDTSIRLHRQSETLTRLLEASMEASMDASMDKYPFCDLSLIAEDTRSVSVHSWVLAQTSELLSSLVKEVPRCQEVRVSVPGVRADTLSHIVTLLYSGVLTVTHREAGEVIEATKLLGISNISKSPNSSEDTERETREVVEAAELLGIGNTSKSPDSSKDTHREAREVIKAAELFDVENIFLPPKQRDNPPQNELLQLSGGVNFDLNGLSQIDNDNISSDEDEEEMSDGEDSDDENRTVNDKIDQLLQLVATESAAENRELDALVSEIFRDSDDEKEVKYHKVTGEVKLKGRGLGRGKGWHQPKQNLSKVCPKCEKEFSNRRKMLEHHRNLHTEAGQQRAPRLCPDCGKSCNTPNSYAHHRNDHHNPNRKVWHCDQCDFRSKHQSNLRMHKQRHHEERAFICDQCSKAFAIEKELEAHTRCVHEGFRLKCTDCEFQTSTKGSLKKHHDMIHLLRKFKCNICSKEYSNRSAVSIHSKRDHGIDMTKYKKVKLDNGKYCMNKIA